MKKNNSKTKNTILDQNKEKDIANKSSKAWLQLSESEALKIIAEFEANQIELKQQNVELDLAKQEAEAAKTKYLELYDFAPMSYFTLSENGKIIELNLSGAKLLGKERSFLLKRKFSTFVSKDKKSNFNNFLENLTASKVKDSCEITLSSKEKSPVYLSVTGILNKNDNNFLLTAVNITKQKKEERSLKAHKNLLELFIKHSPANIAMFDKKMNYISASQSFIIKNDLDPAKVIGRNHYEVFTNIPDRWKETHKRGLAGEILKSDEDLFIRTTGKTDWIKWEVHPWYEKADKVGGIIIFSEFINERKQKEKALYTTQQKNNSLKLQEYANELGKVNADKDQFLSILAHDLKNPLFSMIGFLTLLSENIHAFNIDEIESQINIVKSSASNTMNLLEDILMWTQVHSAKLPYDPQILSFTEICDEIISGTKLIATSKNILINNNTKEDVTLFADIFMIKTILRNLITNALKFTNPGGKINISSEYTDSNIIISVSDNGIGLEPYYLEKLFDVSQIQSTRGTANESGTGLGLLLCKECVEKHGGTIWAESEIGKGSNFKFTLPNEKNS